jgi:hypothetical protein
LMAVRGVCSAVLSTTVLPAARAGPSFHAAMSSGKFQGTENASSVRGGGGQTCVNGVGVAGVAGGGCLQLGQGQASMQP